ncbi:caspase Dronc [Eupeodes corollae]|uniref:caspase Dronc n=1 Tax=Eupeodes corollae TaxID=290404 RepID=UPI0024919D16|nr:caspase Dronc [Eupeodes corollae]XP_055907123.1 caspase Dronc [Eupeodes corollae]XP_055907124.1 caspase Dronc [Eupeodes corollae]
MENSHREHIRKNMNELIRSTSYEPLIKACENKKIISEVMRARIDNLPNAEKDEKHRELFIKLTKRGPTAYNELLKILIDLNFESAARLLRAPQQDQKKYISIHEHNASSVQSTSIEPPQQIPENLPSSVPEGCYPSKDIVDSKHKLVPFTGKIHLPRPFEVIKSKVIHYHPQLKVYPMKSKNRGVFFMVNIIEFPNNEKKRRSGAEVDSKYMLSLFQELGFTCFPYDNLNQKEFFDLLTELRSSEYLKQTESFVMALMTHGEMREDMHDRVEFYGGSIVKVKEIEEFFSNKECKSLRNKPKVLIFPFCRGDAPDQGFNRIETDSIVERDPKISLQMETLSDMLVCYASVRGFQALRDPDEGSWYIQIFCKVLAENAHNTPFEDMLKLIATKIKSLRSPEGYLQTPAYNNHGFDKCLYFNPGVYEE